MRKVFILAAAAGLAGFVGSSGAIAMTSTSPAGVRVATEAMDSTALVHCRSYRHWHPWEHRWTHGCHGGASVVIRHGHRVGVSESIRSRTTISRGETSVRSRSSTSTGVSSSSKSSTSTGMKSGTSTTSKSGTSTTSKSGRAQGGEKSSTGGSTGAGGGSSSGQKQP